ncbi:unnamed protein product [Protopolystoma xenopodis]|uniref:Uncharacterized protein n=1 Tax=Protopolystoma xenopodis TaxID=117903 RepID=A0A448WUK7_9PLAT|nr:unnamed protein product [Protopolystoma xenopodis]
MMLISMYKLSHASSIRIKRTPLTWFRAKR